MMWVQRLKATSTAITREVLAIALNAPVWLRLAVLDMSDVHHTTAEIETRFHRIGNTRPLIAPHHDAIDDHLDEMFTAMIDAGRFLDVVRFAIDTHPHEAVAANFIE